MSAYRPYPKYKDSGVEWLGDVPEGWDTFQGRRVFEQRRDPSLPEDDQLSATQKYGVIPQALFMEQEDQKVVLALNGTGGFKHVEKDDFVISLRSFQGGIEHSAYAGCVSPAYTVLRPQKPIAPRYCAHLLKSPQYVAALQAGTDGIREGKSISYEQFGQITIPLPSVPEQIQIATFLDRECGKLDALQAKQERLIELLKEKRQALISHAVTRGLDPAARLKPSGIEWLGDVPVHWRVTRLRFVIRELESGVSVNSIDTPADFAQFGVLKTSCVYTREFRPDENKSVVIEEMDRVRCPVKKDCLIISRMNTPELVGAAGFVDRDYPTLFLPDRLWQTIFYQPSEEIARFLSFVMSLKGFRDEIGMISTGTSSSMKNIAKEDLLGLTIPFPPLAVQRAIVEYLDEKCGKIDQLKAKAERGIELLKERRSALISAAVTGKIDVRNS